MPVTPTYPGVYIEEIPGGVRTISGVSTSVTAFVGYTGRGLDNRATRIFSFADFERTFGGLVYDSELSYAVQQFFANGGSDAYIVRVPKTNSVAATVGLPDKTGKPALIVTALSRGAWANSVIVDVTYDDIAPDDPDAFNLVISDLSTGTVETFSNVTLNATKNNYVVAVVNDEDNGSALTAVSVPAVLGGRPAENGTVGAGISPAALQTLARDTSYSIRITSDVPDDAITELDVTLLEPGDPIPASMLGLCRVLETKTNLALEQALPGASIRCVPGGGDRLRVTAAFSSAQVPGALQATITFDPGDAVDAEKKGDADAFLHLSTATANVAHYWLGRGPTEADEEAAIGFDGTVLPRTADLIGSASGFTGIYALDKVDLFNLLVHSRRDAGAAERSAETRLQVDPNAIFSAAISLCREKRAMLLVDAPPNVNTSPPPSTGRPAGLRCTRRTARPFSRACACPIRRTTTSCAPSPLRRGRRPVRTIDSARGVWKAPAGTEATLTGVQRPGLQAERRRERRAQSARASTASAPSRSTARSSGARARCVGADAERQRSGSTFRCAGLALFIEESLYRGTQWVVFEPNDEPLWAQIRLNVGAFMHDLFRQGAFQGTDAAAGLLREVRQGDDHAERHRPRHRQHPGRLRAAEAGGVRRDPDPADRRADCRPERASAKGSHSWPNSPSTRSASIPTRTSSSGQVGRPATSPASARSAGLKRTTEVVKHREGGDPSTSRKSPGRTEYDADHARARRHPRPRVRAVGQQGLELRVRPRDGGLARRTSARTSSSRSTTRPASSRSPTRSTAAGSRSTRRCPTSTPTPTPSRSSTSSSRTRAGSATPTSPSRPSPASPIPPDNPACDPYPLRNCWTYGSGAWASTRWTGPCAARPPARESRGRSWPRWPSAVAMRGSWRVRTSLRADARRLHGMPPCAERLEYSLPARDLIVRPEATGTGVDPDAEIRRMDDAAPPPDSLDLVAVGRCPDAATARR